MIKFEELVELLEISPMVSVKEIEDVETSLTLMACETKEELISKRNQIVRWFADKTDLYRKNGNWEMYDKYNNAMSKIVAVIDNKLYSMDE